MPINIKAGEMRQILEAIESVKDCRLPVRAGYWLARIANEVAREQRAFEDMRLELIARFAKKGEDGRPLQDDQAQTFILEDQEGFAEEYRKIAEEDIEIRFDPIKLGLLGDTELKLEDLIRLEKLFVEDGD